MLTCYLRDDEACLKRPASECLVISFAKNVFYVEIMRHPGVVPTNNEGPTVAIVEHQMIKYFLRIFQQKY